MIAALLHGPAAWLESFAVGVALAVIVFAGRRRGAP